MQAVIRWTLGTSWPHSRMASPVHICCASEKARLGRAESAVAAEAMAKRSAILLVRWKVIDAFPKVAAMLAAVHWGALHAVCAAACVIHHAGDPRCGCSNSADVRIKSAAPPRCELCANAAKLQWLAPTLPTTVACAPRRAGVIHDLLSFLRCHTPRRRGIQYAAASRRTTSVSGILDHRPEPVIGRAFARPVTGYDSLWGL
jgi:hypothetical protein